MSGPKTLPKVHWRHAGRRNIWRALCGLWVPRCAMTHQLLDVTCARCKKLLAA